MKIKFDRSGNRILSLAKSDLVGGETGFSIQTLGNLPKTHRDGIGPYTMDEVRSYVAVFGTARQKLALGLYTRSMVDRSYVRMG